MSENKKPKKDTSAKKKREAVELRQAEVELRQAEIYLEAEEERRKWKRHDDRNHGVFRLESFVGSDALTLAAEIQQYARANAGKPITLYVCSPGGSVFAGWVLYDALRTVSDQGHHVTTVLRGYAASMAGIIFLAGDTRLIGSEGFVMIHEVSTLAMGKLSELADEVEFCKRLNQRIEDLYVKRTKIRRQDFRKKSTRKDWWISSGEAVDLKVAHAIG